MLTAKGLRLFLSDRESIMTLNHVLKCVLKKSLAAVWWRIKLEAKKKNPTLFRKIAIFQARCICKLN